MAIFFDSTLFCRGVVEDNENFQVWSEKWQRKNECIRLNYSQDTETVAAGIKIIADEVKRAYDAA